MHDWRITKYNPAYRDETGAYHIDDWISLADVGSTFNGRELTLDEYIAVENKYINAIMLFMDCTKIRSMRVNFLGNEFSLEFLEEDLKKYPTIFDPPLVDFAREVHDGMVLGRVEIDKMSRLILRGICWCRLTNSSRMFVHFGYDYYMYIGAIKKCIRARERIKESGLFVEPFESPYKVLPSEIDD